MPFLPSVLLIVQRSTFGLAVASVGMQLLKTPHGSFVTTGISHRKTLIEMIEVLISWPGYCGLALFKVLFLNNNYNYVL